MASATQGTSPIAYRTCRGNGFSFNFCEVTATLSLSGVAVGPCPGTYDLEITYAERPIGGSTWTTYTETETITVTDGASPIEKKISVDECGIEKTIVSARLNKGSCDGEPGDGMWKLGSVDISLLLGRDELGSSDGYLSLREETLESSSYTTAALEAAPGNGVELIEDGSGAVRQMRTPRVLADVLPLASPSEGFEVRFFRDNQVGAQDGGTGVYDLSGSPFVTHRIENPDTTPGLPVRRLRYSQVRGSTTKIQDYSLDTTTGAWGLSEGGGLRQETRVVVPANGVMIPEGGFEVPTTGSYIYGPTGTGWTYVGGSGVSANGSVFTGGNPSAPEGAQVAFIQGSGSMSRTVTLTEGVHSITALAAFRAGYSTVQKVEVLVDGTNVGTLVPSGSSYTLTKTRPFVVTAGAHTIRFAGTATVDSTAFLDSISIGAPGGTLISVSDDVGMIASRELLIEETYPWGKMTTAEVRYANASDALITHYGYYTNAATDGANYRHLKFKILPTGFWERYSYDSKGRLTKTVSQYLNAPLSATEAASRVLTHAYETIPDLDSDGKVENRRTTVETLLGTESSRRYQITYSKPDVVAGINAVRIWDIACLAPGAAWNDAANLVTKRREYREGLFAGRPVSELRPDNTLATFAYSATADTLTITESQGAASGDGTTVVDGVRTVTVQGANGHLISSVSDDITSGLTLASETVTATDALGRPTRIDYADGSFITRSYACCGLESETDRQGIATNYIYDALGRVEYVSRAGLTIHTTYDAEGRALTVSRIGSDSSTIVQETNAYDYAGRRTSAQDARNRETIFTETVDLIGQRVSTTTYPDLGTRVQTFAQDGTLVSVAGSAAAPARVKLGRDAEGAFRKDIRLGSSGEETEWVKAYVDFAGRPTKTVAPDGATALRFYDGQGRLVRAVDPDGVTTLYAYNARGELETTAVDIDQDGQIDLDGLDRVTRTTGGYVTAHGTTVRRVTTEVWDVDNSATPRTVSVQETAVDGLRTWVTSEGLTSSSESQLGGSGARTETVVSPQQVRTERVYASDRLSSVTAYDAEDAPVMAQTFTYDPHGRLYQAIDSRTGATTYSYFADDQVETITTSDPDPTRTGDGYDPQVTTFGFDAAGRPSTTTLPDASLVTQEYYPNGLVKKVTGSRTYPQEYTYDSQGRMKTLKTWQDYAGQLGAAVTTWNYDPARGWLTNKRHADDKGPAYTYLPSGRLNTRTWARGVAATYGYSTAGELTSVDYSDATPDVAHSYDRLGQLRTTTDAAGTLTRSYTPFGQLDDEVWSGPSPLAGVSVVRSFDTLARREGLAATGAVPVSYGYDAASRLHTVSSGSDVATYGYLPGSTLIESVAFSHGGSVALTTSKGYDFLNRLTNVAHLTSAASTRSFAYTYNQANQRTRATREDGSYWDYGYDALGQVTGATKRLGDGTAFNGLDHGFTFDDIGNRQTATVDGRTSIYTPSLLNQYSERTIPNSVEVVGSAHPEATVTVNATPTTRQGEHFSAVLPVANDSSAAWVEAQVVGVRNNQGPGGEDAVAEETRHLLVPGSPEVFVHDDDGNLTSDGQWAYAWDAESRLISMENPTALVDPAGPLPVAERKRLEFAYDAGGRRFSKKVYTWDGSAWTLAKDHLFVYDGWNMVAELTASTLQPVSTFTWGLDLSGTGQGAGGVGGLLFSASGGATYAQCYDGNGNVTGLVDSVSGAMQGEFEYGAFGELLTAVGDAVAAAPFRFSTKYSDSESSLAYYGFRYYNPSTGRWLSRDPIEENGGVNLYGMVGNGPTNAIDRLGWDPVSTVVAVSEAEALFNAGLATSEAQALANAGISSGIAWGAPVAEVGLGTTVGAGAVALPVGYVAGRGWDQIPELWGGPRISDVYAGWATALLEQLPTEQNRETRQWREFDELQRLRQEYARRKYGTDRALDDCLDQCEKDICPTDPDREAKLKACYCACWKKYPSTRREKTREELIEEWKKLNQKPWPRGATPHHVLPLADGGLDGGANIHPLDPTNHKGYHKEQQDANRWGKRSRRGCDQ